MFDKSRKFRIMAIRPNALLPIELDYVDKKADMLLAAAKLQDRLPDARIHVVRQQGFKNGACMRWNFTGGSLEEVGWWSKSANTMLMEQEYKANVAEDTLASHNMPQKR